MEYQPIVRVETLQNRYIVGFARNQDIFVVTVDENWDCAYSVEPMTTR
jgi:hypothetical protein